MGPSERAKSEKTLDITELACWREAREFVKLIYALSATESLAGDALLVDLLRRHSITVMGKISEGYHHRERNFFLSNLNEAIGILGEVISVLYVAFDQGYLGREELNDTLSKAYTVGIRITSYLKVLESGDSKPTRRTN